MTAATSHCVCAAALRATPGAVVGAVKVANVDKWDEAHTVCVALLALTVTPTELHVFRTVS